MRCWLSSERTTNPSSRRKRQDSLSLSLVLFPPKPLRWVSAGALLGEVIKLPFCIFSAFLCGGGIITLGPLWLCRNNPRGVYFGRKRLSQSGCSAPMDACCSLLHTVLFGVPAWGRYHYPRCAIHAVETLGARWSRRRIRHFYAAPEFALCGLNLPSSGTHTPPQPLTAHTAAHTPKHGGFSGSMVTMFSIAESSTPSTLFRQIRRSPLLLRKDTVMPLLLRASTLLRIRWEKLLGVSPSAPAGSIFSTAPWQGR